MSTTSPLLFKRSSTEAGQQPADVVWVNADGTPIAAAGKAGAKAGLDASDSLVLPRSLVRHAYWETGPLSGRALRSAVELRLAAWQPFAEYQAVVVPGVAGVAVFAWDRQRLATVLAPSGLAPEQVSAWPEPIFQEPLAATGCRLVACRQGYEGQWWQNGELRASRWWAAEPSPIEWQNFLRVARVPAEHAPIDPDDLQPTEVPERSEPWRAARHLDQLVKQERFRWHLLAAGLVLLAALPLAWLIFQERAWQEAERVYQKQQAELVQKTRPLEQARESYLRDFDLLESLQALPNRYPDGLALMAGLSEALTSVDAQLLALRWDQAALQLTLRPQGEMLPRLRYVEVLGALPWLTAVRETDASKGDELVFEAQVAPQDATPPVLDSQTGQGAAFLIPGIAGEHGV